MGLLYPPWVFPHSLLPTLRTRIQGVSTLYAEKTIMKPRHLVVKSASLGYLEFKKWVIIDWWRIDPDQYFETRQQARDALHYQNNRN